MTSVNSVQWVYAYIETDTCDLYEFDFWRQGHGRQALVAHEMTTPPGLRAGKKRFQGKINGSPGGSQNSRGVSYVMQWDIEFSTNERADNNLFYHSTKIDFPVAPRLRLRRPGSRHRVVCSCSRNCIILGKDRPA